MKWWAWLAATVATLSASGCVDYEINRMGNRGDRPGEEPVDTAIVDALTDPPVDTGDTGYLPPVEEDFVSCADVGLWVDQWHGSMPFSHPEDLIDDQGVLFYDPSYTLRDYSTVSIPDVGQPPPGYDKIYLVHMWLDATGPRIFLDLQSDDGLTVYLNGDLIGQWGGDWQEEGCVNDAANCDQFISISPPEITDDVRVGDNYLAVRVSNAINNGYMGLSPRCAEE